LHGQIKSISIGELNSLDLCLPQYINEIQGNNQGIDVRDLKGDQGVPDYLGFDFGEIHFMFFFKVNLMYKVLGL
jgi:hypothetical protein